MKVAIVGATGLVGGIMRKVLEERNFPVSELMLVASKKSVGKTITYKGEDIAVIDMEMAIARKPDVALFSAGGSTSKEWAPKFEEVGCYVIDNSSAWRMDKDKKLIVPEINGDTLTKMDYIIANPNCSTIQLVAALSPLHKRFDIDRLVISTYQSYTGTGMKALNQYNDEKKGIHNNEKAYPHPIYNNCIPHCDIFFDNGYTREELKLVNETQKILNAPDINITATAVRVPVKGGHSESINIEFRNKFELSEVYSILNDTKGIVIVDDIKANKYPMPLNAEGKDDVFVGRIRKDFSKENCLNMWVVSDNLRKGAATNTIQIAEKMIEKGILIVSN